MLTCSKCHKELHESEFHKLSSQDRGYSYDCKKCKKAWRRTKKGLIAVCFNMQSKRYKREPNIGIPTYTLEELREWALAQSVFHELFNDWVKSNYNKDLKPSFDRIDDYQGYSLSNLQITTWKENFERQPKERKAGINNKINKTVVREDGVEYHSSSEASRQMGLGRSRISNAIRLGERAGGYYWHYKNRS